VVDAYERKYIYELLGNENLALLRQKKKFHALSKYGDSNKK